MTQRIRFRLLICLLVFIHANCLSGFAQDTIRYYSNLNVSTNRDLRSAIDLYGKYIDARTSGNINYNEFWKESEVAKYQIPDLASHYILPKEYMAILGLAKLDSNRFLLKTAGFMGPPEEGGQEMMYLYNYIVHKHNGVYRLGNYLDYTMEKKKYRVTNGMYGTYISFSEHDKQAIDSLFKDLEVFFSTEFNRKFTIFNFASNIESLTSRGYDYLVGSLNSKATVSGLFNLPNNIMYTTSAGALHTHELLRSLHTLLPKSPVILRNGIANLCGGSLGLPIEENIRLIYPYLLKHKDVLNDLERFYYYDDQVVPHAVFTAIVANYYLKTLGLESFRQLMKSEDLTEISLEEFISRFFKIDDIPSFLMAEMELYLEEDLEYSDLFMAR